MEEYFAAIDQGTTSTRTMLYDSAGRCVATSQLSLASCFPENAWVELEPEQIWATVLATWREVLHKAGVSANQVLSLGITNQRETTVLWERESGKPLYNAIVWQDRRTADYCERLRQEGAEELVQERTGLLLDPYFSASKLNWLLDHVEGARQQAEAGRLLFGTIDTFLLWRLTGGEQHATDVTNASRTALFNIHSLQWDEELLSLFNIPSSLLPEVKANIDDFGVTDKKLWQAEIPVRVMIGDQQSALVGQGCVDSGMTKTTLGTGAFLMMNTGKTCQQSQHRLLNTIAYQTGEGLCYAMEGNIFCAGNVVRWLRDSLHLITQVTDTEVSARAVSDNQGVYMIPAFTGLGAPYWRPHARATLSGMTLDTKPEHIVRAALESVCYQTHDLLAAMQKDTQLKVRALRVDGGMVSNVWLCQFLANILQRPVLRSRVIEATAYGVAQLLRLEAGLVKNLADVAGAWSLEQSFESKISEREREDLLIGWEQAMRRSCS